MRFVTDNSALHLGWHTKRQDNCKGSNSDLWFRVRAALAERGEGEVQVVWFPSHVDPEDTSLSSHERFYATGNGFADGLCGEAAQFSWTHALDGQRPPDTDLWDCTTALIRRRAAKAMVDSNSVAPWTAERPLEARRLGGLSEALVRSEHCLVRTERKWLCALCHEVVPVQSISAFAETPCTSASQDLSSLGDMGVVRASGSVTVGGKVCHASHVLQFWPKFGLHFCSVCGKTATEDPRHLVAECKATKKGFENLKRIQKGLFPSHAGPSKTTLEREQGIVRREAVLRGPPPGALA